VHKDTLPVSVFVALGNRRSAASVSQSYEFRLKRSLKFWVVSNSRQGFVIENQHKCNRDKSVFLEVAPNSLLAGR